jgi:hypothetical protein
LGFLVGLLLASAPLRATELLQYSFDDYTNASFTLDGSPNPTNGFFSGTATRTSIGNTPNGQGYALDVVGSNSGSQNWLTVSNCDKLSPAVGYITNMTITFWINLQGNPAASDRILSKEVVTPKSGFGVQFYAPSSGTFAATNFEIAFGANTVNGLNKSYPLNAANKWIFCAVTYDGTQPAGTTGYQNLFYYTGTPSAGVSLLGTPNVANNGYITNAPTVPLRIGSTPASGSDRTPPAWIDDVRVYDSVLSLAQIEAIRQQNALASVAVSLSTPSDVFAGTNVTFTAIPFGLGSETPAYQWWYKTNLINGATNASYTINGVQPADSGLYGVVVSNNVANPPIVATAALNVWAQPYNPAALSLAWTLGYSQPNYLTGYGLDRSMVYNAASTNLILCHRASTPYVAVLDPFTGNFKSSLDESGLISLGYANQYALNQVAVGEDGVIYAGNMTLAPSSVPYALYSWQNEDAAQAVCYYGDPGAPNYPNLRWGDAMAVRGSGANTQILLSSADANSNSVDTVFSLLTTSDGVNFASQAFMVTNMPGASANVGLAWGGGNTFYAKSPGFGYATFTVTNQFGATYTEFPFTNQMYYVQFDTNSGYGTVLKSYPTTLVSGKTGPIGTDLSSNLLAGLEVSQSPMNGYDYLSLYSITDPVSGPVLLGRSVLDYNTQNGPFGGVGAVSIGNINGTNYVFVLDTMNGIFTYAINNDSLTPPSPPVISGISPSTGATNGSTLVTITGSNFLSGVTVNFGGVAGTGLSLSGSTNINVYTPPGSPGAVDVTVINSDSLSATTSHGFTYVLPPPAAMLVPGSTFLSGSTLKMVWLGGTNGACELQSTTNLTPPVVWSPVQTNQVGADGYSTNSISVEAAKPAQFFRLAIPYN